MIENRVEREKKISERWQRFVGTLQYFCKAESLALSWRFSVNSSCILPYSISQIFGKLIVHIRLIEQETQSIPKKSL